MLPQVLLRRTGIGALVLFFALSTSTEIDMTEESTIINAKSDFLDAMRKVVTSKRTILKRNHALINNAVPRVSGFRRQLGDNDDNGGVDYYANDAGRYFTYGFNMSLYSLKYASCSAITTFSDDRAADGSAAYEMAQYVVFRLCPSNQCSESDTYGCSYDYGEYMMPLVDWLSTMSKYRAEEFERYCEFCEVCMSEEYYKGEGNDDDGAVAADNDVVQDYYNSTDPDRTCTHYNVCFNYASVCNADDDGVGFNYYSDFFDCTAYDLGDDDQNKVYLGPYCSKKNGSIEIGSFNDEYCSEYAGNAFDLKSLTGLEYIDLSDYYKSDCISCQESTLPYKQIDEDVEDEDNISEVCEDLYKTAAKCNRHIGAATDESYNSEQQEDNEHSVCSFIKSVVTGVYDEYGLIYLNINQYRRDNQQNEYVRYAFKVEEVTLWQIAGIFALAAVCFVLMLWSCLLRRAIEKKIPKQNQEELDALAVQQLSRQNSGIVMCRSKSYNTVTNGTMA